MTKINTDYDGYGGIGLRNEHEISESQPKPVFIPQLTQSVPDRGKHYKFSYRGIKMDPYRIFKIYKISEPANQHAIKKLLRAGQSIKSLEQDIDEVILTLNRWKEMIKEDE